MNKNKIYIAGPEVFLPNAISLGERKKEILKGVGLEGYFPLDNAYKAEQFNTKHEFALAIFDGNKTLMDQCDAIIANITPWRGPEADDGTAFEIGYMCAQGKLVCAYSQTPVLFANRTIEEYYDNCVTWAEGDVMARGPDGFGVEDFGLADNLMLTGALERSGGFFCASRDPLVKELPNGERIFDYDDLTTFTNVVQKLADKIFAQ